MFYYLLFPLVPVFYYCLINHKTMKFKMHDKNFFKINIFIVASLSTLLFFSTFRNQIIGADYTNYVHEYLVNHEWYGEIGFSFIYQISYFIFKDNYWGLSLIINSINFYCIYKFLNKFMTDNSIILIIMLIFVLNPYLYIQSSFNIIRQGLSTSIILLAITYLFDNKNKIFFLLIFIATSIHNISILFVFLYFLKKLNIGKKTLIIIFFVCFIINLVFTNISFLNPLISLIKYNGYIAWGSTKFDFKIYSAFIAIYCTFIFKNYDALSKNERDKNFIDLYILSLCFLLIAVKNDVLYRVYVMMCFFTLPAIYTIIKKQRKCILIKMGFILYYLIIYILFLISVKNNIHYVPFLFI